MNQETSKSRDRQKTTKTERLETNEQKGKQKQNGRRMETTGENKNDAIIVVCTTIGRLTERDAAGSFPQLTLSLFQIGHDKLSSVRCACFVASTSK